jgi:glutathione S-transferase
MRDELVFYTNPMSRGRTVRWMLEELGVPYRTEIVEYGPAMKSPDYLAINPMGKVPALRHGNAIVTEAGAICAYLADAFPEAGFAPDAGSLERASYYRWFFFGAGPIEQATVSKALGFEAPPDRRGMVGYGTIADVVRTLETAISENPYLAGERFTAADVYVGSKIGWTMHFGMLDSTPPLVAYWGRIKDRPAAIKARQIDDALIPTMPATSK